MNEDDIVLQPGASKPDDAGEDTEPQNNVPPASPDASSEPEGAPEDPNNPRVFDFSSDFNISAVSDEPAPQPATKIDRSNAIGSRPAAQPPADLPVAPVPIAASEPKPAPAAPVAPAPQQATASYREPVETSQKWPFAFGAPSSNQPLMNPSASASANASLEKRMPTSQPVKTIRADSEQAAGKEARPAGNLQRDISAILPNMQNAPAAPSGRSGPLVAPNSNIKPLRTYEGDVAEVLSHHKTSSASIAIAENKRKTGEERLGNKESVAEKQPEREARPIPPKKPAPITVREPVIQARPEPQTREEAFAPRPAPSPVDQGFRGAVITPGPIAPRRPSHLVRNLFLAILSFVIIGGGLAGGYYLYTKSPISAIPLKPATPAPVSALSTKSLIPSDSQVSISADGQTREALLARIQAEIDKPQNPNTIKEIVLAQTGSAGSKQIAPSAIASAMNIAVPDSILRTLQPKWMLGVYADASGAKDIFIAATTDTFQNAFSGMLGWEPAMPRDLNAYVNAGTSTPLQGRFIDEIVKNKDVRAFVAPGNEATVFLYSFLDNSMLIMSDNEIALAEIVRRLENQAFVR